jgi:hypothetical protein
MKPTYDPRDIFIRESVSYNLLGRQLQVGDLITFRSPSSPQHFIMKRITAVVRLMSIEYFMWRASTEMTPATHDLNFLPRKGRHAATRSICSARVLMGRR